MLGDRIGLDVVDVTPAVILHYTSFQRGLNVGYFFAPGCFEILVTAIVKAL